MHWSRTVVLPKCVTLLPSWKLARAWARRSSVSASLAANQPQACFHQSWVSGVWGQDGAAKITTPELDSQSYWRSGWYQMAETCTERAVVKGAKGERWDSAWIDPKFAPRWGTLKPCRSSPRTDPASDATTPIRVLTHRVCISCC